MKISLFTSFFLTFFFSANCQFYFQTGMIERSERTNNISLKESIEASMFSLELENSNCVNLEIIDSLHAFDLNDIINQIASKEHLEVLKIGKNFLSNEYCDFDSLSFKSLKNIKRLELSFESCVDQLLIWKKLSKFPNLQELYISAIETEIELNSFSQELFSKVPFIRIDGPIKLEALKNLKPVSVKYLSLSSYRYGIEMLSVFNELLEKLNHNNSIEELHINLKANASQEQLSYLSELSSLKYLDIKFYSVPENMLIVDLLGAESNIRYLRSDLVGDFPLKSINELEKLEEIHINPSLKVTPISDEIFNNGICKLHGLKKITLYRYFDNLNFSQFKEMESLRLTVEGKVIPNSIFKCTKLRDLHITAREVKSLNKEVGNLQNLESLQIEAFNIKELPQEIGRLKKLKEFNMSSGSLRVLPETFENLTELISLNVTDNQLRNLGFEIGNLEKLEFLYLGNGDHVASRLWDSQGSIGVPGNHYYNLNFDFSQLSKLKLIDLSNSYLDSIRLVQLIQTIKSLDYNDTHLLLDGNMIKDLPDMWHGVKLQKLTLSGNIFHRLPNSIYDAEINEIILDDNPLLNRYFEIEDNNQLLIHGVLLDDKPLSTIKNKKQALNFIENNYLQNLYYHKFIDLGLRIDSSYVKSEFNQLYLARYYFMMRQYSQSYVHYFKVRNDFESQYSGNMIGLRRDWLRFMLTAKFNGKDQLLKREMEEFNTKFDVDDIAETALSLGSVNDPTYLMIFNRFCNNSNEFSILKETLDTLYARKIKNNNPVEYLNYMEYLILLQDQERIDDLIKFIYINVKLGAAEQILFDYLILINEMIESKIEIKAEQEIIDRLEMLYEYQFLWSTSFIDYYLILFPSINEKEISKLNNAMIPVYTFNGFPY